MTASRAKYANYVLYNQDSNTKLDGEYDENSLYAITEIKNITWNHIVYAIILYMDSSQNNPFGSFSSGGAGPSGFSASASNGAGDDIILSGATQKKTNKKLIIGIVAGVVLLIGAVVGFLMMQNGMHNASNTTKEKFYKYANYVLYNQDSNTK